MRSGRQNRVLIAALLPQAHPTYTGQWPVTRVRRQVFGGCAGGPCACCRCTRGLPAILHSSGSARKGPRNNRLWSEQCGARTGQGRRRQGRHPGRWQCLCVTALIPIVERSPSALFARTHPDAQHHIDLDFGRLWQGRHADAVQAADRPCLGASRPCPGPVLETTLHTQSRRLMGQTGMLRGTAATGRGRDDGL